jgi:uncharacterized membrane protein
MDQREANAMISMVGFIFTWALSMKMLALILLGKFLWDLCRLAIAVHRYRKWKKRKNNRNFLEDTLHRAMADMTDDEIQRHLDNFNRGEDKKDIGF